VTRLICLCISSARGTHLPSTIRYEGLHPAWGAVGLEVLFENLVNLALFVVVFDLPTALLDTGVAPVRLAATGRADAHVTRPPGHVAGPIRSGVEVLMEAVVAGHDHHGSVMPVAFHHVGTVFLGPHQRVAAGAA